jgi:hypothetical protein
MRIYQDQIPFNSFDFVLGVYISELELSLVIYNLLIYSMFELHYVNFQLAFMRFSFLINEYD